MALLKFTRKEGEGYKSELQIPQEYKDVRVMVEDVVKSNGRIRESLEMNHSVSLNDSTISGLSGMDSKPYDEWEAIQRELALYPDARDRDDMVRFSLTLLIMMCQFCKKKILIAGI